ncbi:IPT/TIG domain-containing protein [uncultured Jatrophihabitans sp.]|uniref:IPT/TIG domain-containing protein n=1 Tax=uncultured Jatrophihabitans sp. TaxID=1610747 RepID=UPI0035CB0ADE
MKLLVRALCLIGSLALIAVLVAVPALAGVHPSVTAMSTHRGEYWGGTRVTVWGHNFSHVKKVMFGAERGYGVHVVSPSKLTVYSPDHRYGTTHVRVVTSYGWSAKTAANKYTFARPTMNSHIQGGLTGHQEQQISARVRHAHHGVYVAPRAGRWTAAMGVTAVSRARSWLGIPYSWAGGNSRGPSKGVCAHNGGDLDCHIIGFDCSGLSLYSWAPYRALAHSAATQRGQAGRFHPSIGQLVPGDLVFFSGYIAGGVGHVAIYEGNGNVIEAPESGSVVRRSRLVDVIAGSGVYRGATRPTSSGKQAPGPALTFRTAQLPTSGGYLTLKGRNLSTATTVVVAGKTYYSFASRSASQLVVKVAAHRAGNVSVAVSNPWGTSKTSTGFVGAPKVAAVAPAQGTTAGGNRVTVTGANLAYTTNVLAGGTAATFHVVNPSTLWVWLPPHAVGPVTLNVVTHTGTSNGTTYTYVVTPAVKKAAPTRSGPTATTPPVSTPTSPTSGPTSSTPPVSTPTSPTSGPTTTAPPVSTPTSPTSGPTSSTPPASATATHGP